MCISSLRKSKQAKANEMTMGYAPQDINSMAQARAVSQRQSSAQQQAQQQAAALQQAAAVQLAAAQLQAAYSQQNGGYLRQNSNEMVMPNYGRQNSTSSTAALIPQRSGSVGNTGLAATGFSSGFDNHLNAKLNNWETASNASSSRTAGGGNVYDLPNLSRKGKPPPPPPVDLDIVAAAKQSAFDWSTSRGNRHF